MSFNPLELEGRTVLITGATSGIGRETAVLLSKLGASLVLVARDADRLKETVSLLEGNKHKIAAYDLRSPDISGWLLELARESGPFHGLVHSAGVHMTRPLRILKSSDVDEVMSINFGAALALVKAFRQKGVYDANGGSVVLVASVMGLVGQPGVAIYSASKGALVAMSKSLALELARDRIRVNCIAPGQLQTPMASQRHDLLNEQQVADIAASHPLGLGTPLDVAFAIAFLLADTGRWITGSTLVVDGGYTAR